MQTSLRGNSLVVTGSNRNGRYDFSYSTCLYFNEKQWPLPDNVTGILEAKLNPPPFDIDTLRWKTPPWRHQEQGVGKWLRIKRAALYHAMGAGKSCEALTGIGHLFWTGQAKRALIVCPLSVFSVWPGQFTEHGTEGTLHVIRETKQGKELLKDLPERAIVLVNYEKLALLEKELTGKFDIIVADEATKIKNPSAQRTKVLYRIAKDCPYVLIMTGTPVSKNLIDVFGEYMVMDPFWFGRSFWMFKQRYCVMGGWMGHQIVGYQREDELRKIIDIPSHRITKQEALPYLPPKVFEERICEMTPEQKKLYKETQKKFWVEFQNKTLDIKNAASRIVKLQEIANGFFITDEGETIDVASSKIDCLAEAIEEVDPEERITVWSRFKHDIKKIREMASARFPDRPVFVLSGDERGERREEEIVKFKNTPGSFLLANIQAGGLGIHLTECHLAFIYSKLFDFSLHEQMQDRHHRPGQENAVTYVDIITENSIDRRLQRILASRKTLSDWLMEDRGRLADFFEPRGR